MVRLAVHEPYQLSLFQEAISDVVNVTLPVIDNISRIFAVASSYGTHLRTVMTKKRASNEDPNGMKEPTEASEHTTDKPVGLNDWGGK